MPLSSARETSGQSRRAAAVAAQPIRRILDSIDAIANLHAVFAVAATKGSHKREGLNF
jgi:hypothetical protein